MTIHTLSHPQRLNVAVIGTGIAGMSAAWLLAQKHNVTVFEKDSRIGGHSNTVLASLPEGEVPVDTGFIVFNDRNYPNLESLFEHLGVTATASNMSFAASIEDGALEYNATVHLNQLLGQRRNALRPRYWRMVRDILRFYPEARKLLKTGAADHLTLGDHLVNNRYSKVFIRDHLLPLGAAIWSTRSSDMMAYPLMSFLRFFNSHGLLDWIDQPQWKSLLGGSREYVKRLTAGYADKVRLNADIASVTREAGRVMIHHRDGQTDVFDHVVIATHADAAHALLGDRSEQEETVLGAFSYTPNRAVLHTDERLMPHRRRVWASWNYISTKKRDDNAELCVSYWMNSLQQLPTRTDVFVTLNPVREPEERKIIREFDYAHPLFNQAALAAQSRLWQIQGERNTWFCGSYFGHGFHEDALQAGLAVAEMLGGVRRPWEVAAESDRIWNAIDPRAAAQ